MCPRQLTFQGEWVSISGNAELTNDRMKVHKFYSPTLRAWLGDLGDGTHDGGPDDPVFPVHLGWSDRSVLA